MSEYYEYLIYAAYVPVVIICLMMATLFVSLLASIKTGFSGKFILHKKHPIYFMRYGMMFPQALFLAIFFRNNLRNELIRDYDCNSSEYYKSRWQITKNLCHDYVLRELNLCKIFWSQLISIVVFLPINLAFTAIAVPMFIIVAPIALVGFLIWKAFILVAVSMLVGITDLYKMIVSYLDQRREEKLSSMTEEEILTYKFGNEKVGYKGLTEFNGFIEKFKMKRSHKTTVADFFGSFELLYDRYNNKLIDKYLEELLGEEGHSQLMSSLKYYRLNGATGEKFIKDSLGIIREILNAHEDRKVQLSAILGEVQRKIEENDRLERLRQQRAIEKGERWMKRWEFLRDVIYRKALCPTFEYVESKDKGSQTDAL